MDWLDFNSAGAQAAPANAPDWANKPKHSREEVLDLILPRLESVLGYIYPNGHADPKGRCFHIGDVTGSPGESLNVVLQGERAGLWHDFATGDGGDIFDLWRHARGLRGFADTLEDMGTYAGASANTPRRPPKRKASKGGDAWGVPTSTYNYTDPNGTLIAQVDRFDWEADGRKKKAFRPWDVATRSFQAPTPRPLYNLPGVARSPEIVLVEGEKCADALNAAGIVATTAMSGSNAPPEQTDWTPLQGRSVVIWPDNDQTGLDYAERAKAAVEAAGAVRAQVLRIPPGKPPKWDAADAIAEGEDPQALLREMRGESAEAEREGVPISAPFRAWEEIDLSSIPYPEYVYSDFYARGYTSVTLAPPKVGKSLLALTEAIDIATGRGILTGKPANPQKVVYYNAEDDQDVINHRVSAILTHYQISQSEIVGRLYATSGVDQDGFYLVSGQEGNVNEALFETLGRFCDAEQVDALIFDPLQDLSRSPETNEVFRLLGQRIRRFASTHGVALGLIHHTRKMQAGVKASIDDMRGGSALRGTSRFNRLLVPMSEDEAAKANVQDHHAFFRIGDVESNLAPPSSDVNKWFEKISVRTPSGCNVGALRPWQWPDAMDGVSVEDARAVRRAIMARPNPPRANIRANDWAGHVIGETLGFSTSEKGGKAKASAILAQWVSTGVLQEGVWKDARAGREVETIEAGPNDLSANT